jgi:hypothetical protein
LSTRCHDDMLLWVACDASPCVLRLQEEDLCSMVSQPAMPGVTTAKGESFRHTSTSSALRINCVSTIQDGDHGPCLVSVQRTIIAAAEARMRCCWSILTRSLDGGTLTTPTRGSVVCPCCASEKHRVRNRGTCMQIAAGVAHRPNTLAKKGLARQVLATLAVWGILKLARVDLLTDVMATADGESEMNLDQATMGGVGSALRHAEEFIWIDRVSDGACMWLLGGVIRVCTLPKQWIGEYDREHVALAGPVELLEAVVSVLWWFVTMCWWVTDVRNTRLIWYCCTRRLTCRQDRAGEVVVDGWPKDEGNRNGAATIAVMLATTRASTLDARATEVTDMPIGVLSQASGEVYRHRRICVDIVVLRLFFLIG